MSLLFNIRHLEEKNLHLEGEISGEELDLQNLDELVHVPEPLRYDIELEKMEQAVLAQGTLTLNLHCECARCLKPHEQEVKLEHWACHLPLEGEDKVNMTNDCVDLTPYIREDIVLAFPQHPLCKPDCGGLIVPKKKGKKTSADATPATSAWAALDQLKLKE